MAGSEGSSGTGSSTKKPWLSKHSSRRDAREALYGLSLKNEIMGSLNGIGMDHFTFHQQVEILWGLPEYGE
jgi:hypothetical protein